MNYIKSLIICCLISPLTAWADPPAEIAQREAARIQVIEKISAATVAVVSGGGSGVLISPDGYCLTNFHVSGPSINHKCGLNDGKVYDAVLVSADPGGDLALLRLQGRNDFPYAPLADSDEVRVGDWCIAAGNPFALAEDYSPSVSYGIVSGIHRYQEPENGTLEYGDCIQLDAAGNPGNSGGPSFNTKGEIIGINGRISLEKRGRVNVGVTYAISANQCKKFLTVLKSGRVVDHASLGAKVDADRDGRVIITDIITDSDAYRRGLRYGDEIVEFAGRRIPSVNAFKNVLTTYPSDWRVPVTFRRNGQVYRTLVKLTKLHQPNELERMLYVQLPKELPDEVPKPDREGSDDKKQDGEKPEEKKPDDKNPAPAAPSGDNNKEYEKRAGFVNYYFNRTHQDRVWKAFVKNEPFTPIATNWSIEADLVKKELEAGKATIELNDEFGSIVLPDGESKAAFYNRLQEETNPPGSGGLLVALHLWQRLLKMGMNDFGNIYYRCEMPLPISPDDQNQMVDVLTGTYRGVEVNFFFNTAAGRLVGMEMIPTKKEDSAEIYFSDFRNVNGRELPFRWESRSGTNTFAVFNIKQFGIAAAVEK